MAKLVNQLPEGADWSYEIKLDGYRALVIKANNDVTIYSRRGNVLNSRFGSIANAFGALADGSMLDGEIVAVDDHGRPSFNILQNSRGGNPPLYFYAFDVLAYRGQDTRQLTLLERRQLLKTFVLADLGDPVRLSATFETDAATLLDAARKQGLEGLVAKRTGSLYESGERSGAWVKYKTDQGQELVIGGYLPGAHVFDSLLAGYYSEPGKLKFIAKIRNGFTPMLRRTVAQRFQGLETDVCPFANLPEPKNARRGEALTRDAMRKCKWLKPELVAQVEFTEWTTADHLRHSKFVALRDDKNAEDVVKEADSS